MYSFIGLNSLKMYITNMIAFIRFPEQKSRSQLRKSIILHLIYSECANKREKTEDE